MSKIIGNTVGMGLPKPNLMQNDPTKGDYVLGKEEFLAQAGSGQNPPYIASDTPPENTDVLWLDTSDDTGERIELTDAQMQDIVGAVLDALPKWTGGAY